MGKIRIKQIILLSSVLLLVGILTLIGRGPYISNQLKKLILPELSAATGREVFAQKIYLNIFPLTVEVRDLRVFENGNEILHLPKVKSYIEISGLLKRELVLRRLVIQGLSIRSDESQLTDIIRRVKEYLAVERKSALKVVLKALAMNDGTFTIDYRGNVLRGSGLSGEAILKAPHTLISRKSFFPRITFAVRNLSSQMKDWPELKGEIKGSIVLRDDTVEIKGLQLGFYGSMVQASGIYAGEHGGLHVRLGLFMESVKKIFGLKQKGEGGITAKGTVHVIANNPMQSTVDMELKGELYLEALMELLRVKERVEGLVAFTGDLKGPLNSLTGNARARLKKGNLFGVDLDELTSTVLYRDGKLFFNEGKAALSHGTASAEATIAISGAQYYSLNVKGSGIDSKAVFKFIGWDPGIPAGKVEGELHTAGEEFAPSGWFGYESLQEGEDVLGRVKRAKGSYKLQKDVLTLSDAEVSTLRSQLRVNGTIDIAASVLSLETEMKTSDIKDLTSPYLRDLTGSGDGGGTVTGKLDNPVVSWKVKLHGASFDGYHFGNAAGDLNYRKDLLEIKDVTVGDTARSTESLTAKIMGTIGFPEAKDLFDLRNPHYALQVIMKNGSLDRLARIVYKKGLDPSPKGMVGADLHILGTGPTPLYEGSLRVGDFTAGDVSLDSVTSSFSYNYNVLSVKDLILKKGGSAVTVEEGRLSRDETFSFRASGRNVFLKDIAPQRFLTDTRLSFRAEGRGTLDNPEVEAEGALKGWKFRNLDVGDGTMKVSLKGKTMIVNALFFDEKVMLAGKADLKGDMPWTAHLDVKSGRYDFLLQTFLKEIPEDLLVSMRGHADMSGDRNHFSAGAVVNQLNVTLFGYSFASDSEIRFEVRDKKVIFPGMNLRGGTTAFKVRGSVEVNKGYDLVMEGNSDLSPLKGFSKKFETIKGEAAFDLSVKGAWDNPKMNGTLSISDGLIGMRGIPYQVSSINGSLNVSENKIVTEKLSGRVGGGDINLSGVAYLQALKITRFYIDSVISNVRADISKDFPANFSGTLLYKGTLDLQSLSGDIKINHALYRERVDWQSWLLKAKTKERPRGEIGAVEKTSLNIRIQSTDNVVIDNNIARASLKLDLLLRGSIAQPVFFGRVEMLKGTVYFRNNEFKILSARADFSDPKRINPVMNIVAETSIQGYTIRLNLEGQFDHFNLSLSSNPSLEETEILSLLTVGTLQKESKGIQGGIGVSAATTFLAGQFQDVAQERIRSITGIDRLNVAQYTSQITGKTEPRVTATKRLGDRLSVSYSTALGSASSYIILVEYDVTNSVSLIGLRDEAGGLGGGIKFRFGFK